MPIEVLIEILSYVREQTKVSQTCKIFYEISCKITKLHLNIDLPAFNEIPENTFDPPTFCGSKRRVTSLRISCRTYRRLDTIYAVLTKILERFSDDIEELELKNVNLNRNTINILNLLPNVKKLTMICVASKNIPRNFNLLMPKLKTISAKSCNRPIMDLINTLPNDVLNEIHLDLNPITIRTIILFQNQRNLKVVSTVDGNTRMLAFRNMKLKSLSVSNFTDVDEVLTGQNELTFLHVSKVQSQREINTIARELVALQILEVEEFFQDPDFSVLANLKNLQSLKFSRRNYSSYFTFVISRTLQELHASNLIDLITRNNDFTTEVLPRYCPNLHTISFSSSFPTTLVNKILFGFPHLKRLNLETVSAIGFETTNGPQNFDHLHLKELNIGNIGSSYRKLKEIVTCLALETVKIDMNLAPNSLHAFLARQPSIKFLHIKVSRISLTFIASLKSSFRNIVEIKIESNLKNHEYFVNLKEELNEVAPNSKLMKLDDKNLMLVVN